MFPLQAKNVFKIALIILLCPTNLAPQTLNIKDPVIIFHSIIFKAIDGIMHPRSLAPIISTSEHRILVEKLDQAKKEKSAFFYGFMLSFFRYGVISILQKTIKPSDLELISHGLCEFLLSRGFKEPATPNLLLGPISLNKNMSQVQRQNLAECLFDEFFQIHHYAMAWQEFSEGLVEDVQTRAEQTMSQSYKDQLQEELETINFEIEREKLLYEKDKVETMRTKEQKIQKLEDLSFKEKLLEFEQQKNRLEHENALQSLALQRQRNEAEIKTAKEKLELNHNEKLSELERKKKELEVKAQDVGFFEKTINKFSQCLSALSNVKQINLPGQKL